MKNRYIDFENTFEKFPKVNVKDYEQGIINTNETIAKHIRDNHNDARIIVVECYPGVDYKTLNKTFFKYFEADRVCVDDYALDPQAINEKIAHHLTDDRVFGIMSHFEIEDFYADSGIRRLREEIGTKKGRVIVYGFGAGKLIDGDLTLYLDLARFTIKKRYRAKTLSNWKMSDYDLDPLRKEKRGFFIEWRTADRIKKNLFDRMDYYLDANDESDLKMVTKTDFFKALDQTVNQPFSMVPYFDPGVWGGQWMKEVCDLDREKENYAWSFNGVMEENSMHYRYGADHLESPAINLVFFRPTELLGAPVHGRFGTEFPIRFDFLDTMEGGNLSLQVHPLTEYIQDKFGMAYTQDESYYILDSKNGGVYLGLKDGIDREAMITDLKDAEAGKKTFDAGRYINHYSVKPHDHVSIPAGTIHCSATNTMVLEISATPYIFTFKMWDWGRLGSDGVPRPIHLEHGLANIQWDRTTSFVEKELINPLKTIREEPGVKEESTGLHERQFIETRRHTFNKKTHHETDGSVNMMMLVEGQEALVESPQRRFEPFTVHYAESFIVPDHVKSFTITPSGPSRNKTVKTIKAYVRH